MLRAERVDGMVRAPSATFPNDFLKSRDLKLGPSRAAATTNSGQNIMIRSDVPSCNKGRQTWKGKKGPSRQNNKHPAVRSGDSSQ